MRDVGMVAVEDLLLDPQNPRIPEDLQDEPQDVLLKHLFDNDVLDELGSSFLANGYFENEPLLVLPPNEAGKRVVVEGNRRLATLLVLLGSQPAIEADLSFDFDSAPTGDVLAGLRAVPCFEVASRAEVSAYLGYRHIGGLRQWPAEAKARFIAAQVRQAELNDIEDPFYFVGRVIGSNARGVRSSYETLEILRFAHQELSFDTLTVRSKRFTVWGLLVANSDVREFINYSGRPRTLPEVRAAISQIDESNLIFVLGDLVPTAGSNKPVLADSRAVSTYAEVIKDERARAALEKYDDLTLAASLVQRDGIAVRLERVARTLETILVDVPRLDVGEDAVAAAARVLEFAETIEGAVERRAAK